MGTQDLWVFKICDYTKFQVGGRENQNKCVLCISCEQKRICAFSLYVFAICAKTYHVNKALYGSLIMHTSHLKPWAQCSSVIVGILTFLNAKPGRVTASLGMETQPLPFQGTAQTVLHVKWKHAVSPHPRSCGGLGFK